MQSAAKIAFASLALLGIVAAVAPAADAQSYGYGYGYEPPGYACGRNLSQIVNYIIDPATGRSITQAEYQSRYPWTNPSTWTYDCASNLWTDHTPQGPANYQASRDDRHDGDRNQASDHKWQNHTHVRDRDDDRR